MRSNTTTQGLYAASTVTSLFWIFICFLIHHGRQKDTDTESTTSKTRKTAYLPPSIWRVLTAAIIALCYLAETVLVIVELRKEAGTQQSDSNSVQDHVISSTFFAVAWAIPPLCRWSFMLTETAGLSVISLAFGIPLLILDGLKSPNKSLGTFNAALILQAVRLAFALGLLVECFVRFILIRHLASDNDGDHEEASSLLTSNGHAGANGHGSYSTISNGNIEIPTDHHSVAKWDDEDGDGEAPSNSRIAKLRTSGSWMAYLQNFKVVMPFLIPRKTDFVVLGSLLVCVLCVIASRVLNILVPYQMGVVADRLFAGEFPYQELVVYFLLSLVHTECGLDMVQTLAKVPIEQFSHRQLANAALNHVMSLSMDFHSDRDSAEVMKSIEQGSALTRFLETAVLEMAPIIFDMFIAFGFLYIKFNSTVAVCMLASSFAFIATEMVTSSWTMNSRHEVAIAEVETARIMHQAVQAWQTVSAFNMFTYEKYRYGAAVDKQLKASRKWTQQYAVIGAIAQSLVPATFLLIGLLVAHEVYVGNASAGDFVFLVQYWDQLIMPIKVLTHIYSFFLSDLVSAEQLLELLTTEPSIKDKEGATDLGNNVQGEVTFEHVNFSYDGKRTAVKDVSVSAAPGQTIALVGTTGAGKSTLVKLLMRYYDISEGSIKIDGQDIRDITLNSLRDVIGVVPQDPLLFNASIMENLRYARLDASDEEIHEACRASAIHDKILTFTEGYETKVGEQGVKLSGGEVQRLAIARAFLKDPRILILDEATSSVDTETEAHIQEALGRLMSHKRTTFVIAHRLSTVARAGQILVVDDGTVIESGTHGELMMAKGKYHSLWQKQLGGLGLEEAGKSDAVIEANENES